MRFIRALKFQAIWLIKTSVCYLLDAAISVTDNVFAEKSKADRSTVSHSIFDYSKCTSQGSSKILKLSVCRKLSYVTFRRRFAPTRGLVLTFFVFPTFLRQFVMDNSGNFYEDHKFMYKERSSQEMKSILKTRRA